MKKMDLKFNKNQEKRCQEVVSLTNSLAALIKSGSFWYSFSFFQNFSSDIFLPNLSSLFGLFKLFSWQESKSDSFMFSRFSGGRANPIPKVRPSGIYSKSDGKFLEKIFATRKPSQARMHPNRSNVNRKSKLFEEFAVRENKNPIPGRKDD